MFGDKNMFFKKKKAAQSGELDMSNIPKHIGIIMDGNGRWAAARGLPRSAGHRKGAEILEGLAVYCGNIGIEVITAYAFSTENWSRPKDEVDYLMNLLYDYLSDADRRFKRNNIRFIVSGDMSAFDERLQGAIKNAVEITKDGTAVCINLALNYGGRDEIVRAARAAAEDAANGKIKPCDIDEKVFSSYLDTAGLPEVDFILRPGGEHRLSNFLLWQAAYSEFIFSDVYWPDFTERDLDSALLEYQHKTRRFGGV